MRLSIFTLNKPGLGKRSKNFVRFVSFILSLGLLLGIMCDCRCPDPIPRGTAASFADFDARATAGGQILTVAFFGGSLTWGANASDPQKTSYRALMADYLRQKYPKTSFRFIDAAIGGTGSELGIFRIERDVLAYHPDLGFLDFTANDGLSDTNPTALGCYESLLRRMIRAGVPVVQAYFGFKGNVGQGYNPSQTPGYAARRKLADDYHTAAGDLFTYLQPKLVKGELNIDQLWPIDGVHPGDPGYKVFFEAVRNGLDDALQKGLVCTIPDHPTYSDKYEKWSRLKLIDTPLPSGWTRTLTYRTGAWFDGQSSRWMGDVAMCDEKDGKLIQPLHVSFTGTMVAVFGEADENGLDFKATVDGQPVPYQPYPGTSAVEAWPFNMKMIGHGCLFVYRVLSTSLPPGNHVLEITPVFSNASNKDAAPATPTPPRQLRIESICSAGG